MLYRRAARVSCEVACARRAAMRAAQAAASSTVGGVAGSDGNGGRPDKDRFIIATSCGATLKFAAPWARCVGRPVSYAPALKLARAPAPGGWPPARSPRPAADE